MGRSNEANVNPDPDPVLSLNPTLDPELKPVNPTVRWLRVHLPRHRRQTFHLAFMESP